MSNDPVEVLQGDPQEEAPDLSRYQNFQASIDTYLRFIDITAAILLAIATVATAWCAYQSSRWSGVQATAFAQASGARIESNSSFNLALAAINYDTMTFIEWLNARQTSDAELFKYVNESLVREDFQPYLDQWVKASDYEELPTPLESDAYINDLLAPTIDLQVQSAEKFEEATEANQTSDDYVLATVLFASVLFFAGISGKFERLRVQGALVLMAIAMLGLGAFQVAGLPIQ